MSEVEVQEWARGNHAGAMCQVGLQRSFEGLKPRTCLPHELWLYMSV